MRHFDRLLALANLPGSLIHPDHLRWYLVGLFGRLGFDPSAYDETPLDQVPSKLCLNWHDIVVATLLGQPGTLRAELGDLWPARDAWTLSAASVRYTVANEGLSRDLGWDYAGKDITVSLATLVVLTTMLDIVKETRAL